MQVPCWSSELCMPYVFDLMRICDDVMLCCSYSIEHDSDHLRSPDTSMTGPYRWMAGVGRDVSERAWRARKWNRNPCN